MFKRIKNSLKLCQTLHIFHNRRQVSLVIRVPNRAVCPNLALCASQDTELPHLRHGDHELLEEQRLVHSEAFNNLLGLAKGVQILIRIEETLAVHEIDVVLVVEGVRGSDILDSEGVRVIFRAHDFEVLGEGLVHDRVRCRVKTVVEDGAGAATRRREVV
ncbi:hypothetical protein TorRG33x02_078350 [Trema orientale]|uniref:Uncharacterized protein n=1 Tax=Trema orientale TaxID=63057 RepID=A0A2P5FEQ4_TREOI|nr:hypothetical protein TorRG33x02_078350 [Trema orientale]